MRVISASQQGVIDSGVQAEHVRVSIKDSGGTFRDLTTYPTFNAVRAVSWKEAINDPHATFDLTLARELHQFSLSPFVAASALNRGFNPSAGFAALIALTREVKIEVAVCQMDKQPVSADWMEVFRGRVDSLDAASGKDITVSGRSLGGRLAQQFIKTELVYSYAADGGSAKALRVWEPSIAVTTSPLVYLLPATRGDDDPGLNKFLKCDTAGTTGTTEPVWTTGADQVDGTAKWDYVAAPTSTGNPVEQIMQNILDDNKLSGDPTVTLYTPTTPGWSIRQFIQQRTFTLDGVRALATQIGWDLRYKWRVSAAEFQLTFYAPTRASPSVNFTFAAADYKDPSKLAVDIAQIRNSVRVIYADRADLWPDGTPKRKEVNVSDSGSITKYGELWMEIQEDESANIDTSTEATTLANAALSDLKEPTAEFGVELMRGFPWVELNDYYTFSPNKPVFDSAMSLAVTAYSHSFEGGKMMTSLELRGLPTAGSAVYLEKQNHPAVPVRSKGHQVQQFQGKKTPKLNFLDVVGGTRISLGLERDKNKLLEEYEIHVYPTAGTTLDSSTLANVIKGDGITIPNLLPGATYYARVSQRGWNSGKLIRGQPSKEVSFVAGRASTGHIKEGIALGELPLNGGFETRLDPAGMPDHWTIVGGTLGTQVQVMEDGNGMSGARYMRLTRSSSINGAVATAIFPVTNERPESDRYGGRYYVSWWRKAGSSNSAGANYNVMIQLLDYQGNEVTIATGVTGAPSDNKTTHWVKEGVFVTIAAGADPSVRQARLRFELNAAVTTNQVDFDLFRTAYIGTPWYEVGDTSKFTDNYESIPGFQNTFLNYGGGNSAVAFRRDQHGRVFIKGMFKHATTTTIAAVVFTLPVGYRPSTAQSFIVVANEKAARVTVGTNGDVYFATAQDANPSTFCSLDAINFVTFD